MMTVRAARLPRVTLMFAMMGSGTTLAMKRPPAGPPTPMPRSRMVSWRFMDGSVDFATRSECNDQFKAYILSWSPCSIGMKIYGNHISF